MRLFLSIGDYDERVDGDSSMKGDDDMKRNAVFMIVLIFLLSFSTFGFAAGEPATTGVIVRFDKSESLDIVAKNLRGQGVEPRVLALIHGVAFKGSPQAIEALGKRFSIVSISEDYPVYALRKGGTPGPPADDPGDPPAGTEIIDWGVLEIRADEVWSDFDGSGVKVAVVDTGIDVDHPDLDVAGGANFDRRAKSYDDNNGHGTHVAGTIAAKENGIGVVGVAPKAELYAVKVLDRKGSGLTSQVIAGIDWAVANGMDVVNLSLGSNYPNSDLEDALELAMQAGVIIVAAAGNDGSAVDFPGAYASTIGVGAINPDQTLAYFSSRGAEVDVVAPGVAVYSTYRGGGYRELQGTSMATPHVAGLAALFRAKYPGASLNQFRLALQQSSVDLGVAGFDPLYGYGLVDAQGLLQ